MMVHIYPEFIGYCKTSGTRHISSASYRKMYPTLQSPTQYFLNKGEKSYQKENYVRGKIQQLCLYVSDS